MVKTFDCGSSNIRSIRIEHPKLIIVFNEKGKFMTSVFILEYYPSYRASVIAGVSQDYDTLKEVAEKIMKNTGDGGFIILEYEPSNSAEDIYSSLSNNSFNGIKVKHMYRHTLGEHGYFWNPVC